MSSSAPRRSPPSAPAPPPASKRIAVVGGGISGLAAAHRLVELKGEHRENVALTLFEAGPRLGGAFGSERVGEYLIERGADAFVTNKPGGTSLCRRLGMTDRLIATDPRFRRSLILKGGRPVPTPEGFNLLAPGRLWPMVKTPLLSWKGKLRMAAECLIPRRADDADESLADFVRRRFGAEVLDRLAQPMVAGIYTADPERLSIAATLPQFPEMERACGSVTRGLRRASRNSGEKEASGARYRLFAAPRNGMQELLETLKGRLEPHVDIRMSAGIERIAPEGLTLHTTTGEQLPFDRVLLALPAYRAADLIEPQCPGGAEVLRQIDYASSAVVVSGHRLADVEHPLGAFGLVIPHCEGRRILAVSFLSRKFEGRAPEGKAILRTFVGGAMQPEEYARPDEEIKETVLRELHELLGVRGEPEFMVLARHERAMPQYTLGHRARVDRIRQLIGALPGISLAGNAYDGVGIPDCIQSAERAAEEIWTSL